MKQAIANHRALDKIVEEMREITQILILNTPETSQPPHRAKRPKTALT